MQKTSARLLRWYNKNGRDLPWRKTTDPYAILVSEIMLQQTQVDRVKRFYREWLKRFPDWETLAQAGNADVIEAWSGLGYNRRALTVRDIARQVVENGVPRNKEAWMALKGVGPYTSSAVALFAQKEKVFPVDSIIRRVMGRYYLRAPFADAKRDEEIEKHGLRLLNQTKQYEQIPQAIFDLGTAVCKKNPDCSACPLRRDCSSAKLFLSGNVKIPKRSIKKAKERIHPGKSYPDRIYRGRILRTIKSASEPLKKEEIIPRVDTSYEEEKDKEWFEAMLQRLTREGFLEHYKNKYLLSKN